MPDFSWTTFLSSLVGSGVTAWLVVRGLGGHLADRWLAKYKGELDKEFEKYRDTLEQRRKRVEADLGKRTYVNKAQFDAEFNAIKDIFAALGKLRLSFNNLFNNNNINGITLANSTPTQAIAANGTTYTDPFNAAGPTTISGADNVAVNAGRSIMLTVTFGTSMKR